MTNSIQSNYRNRQIGFGMSQFRDLEVLAKNPEITTGAAEAIAKYIKEEAPIDGKNILLYLVPSRRLYNDISASVKRKPVGLWQSVKSLFSGGKILSVKYNSSNPVASFKDLTDNALKFFEEKEAKEIDTNDKAKIFNVRL
ncbi:MAG: hypothetical protein WCG23_01140 [bacterium]